MSLLVVMSMEVTAFIPTIKKTKESITKMILFFLESNNISYCDQGCNNSPSMSGKYSGIQSCGGRSLNLCGNNVCCCKDAANSFSIIQTHARSVALYTQALSLDLARAIDFNKTIEHFFVRESHKCKHIILIKIIENDRYCGYKVKD